MIPGIVAAQNAIPVAVNAFNFLTGTYTVNGVTFTLAEIFDPYDVTIDENGLFLEVDLYNPNPVINLTAEALAAIPTTGFTVVIEFAENAETYSSDPFGIIYVDETATNTTIEFESFAEEVLVTDYASTESRYALAPAPAHIVGEPRRVGITWTPARLAISADGNAAVATTTSVPSLASFFSVTLGGAWGGDITVNMYVREFSIYPAVTDAQLQSLTAL